MGVFFCLGSEFLVFLCKTIGRIIKTKEIGIPSDLISSYPINDDMITAAQKGGLNKFANSSERSNQCFILIPPLIF